MIYLTLTTCNRFWHCALTALSLAGCNRKDCFVHVIDDASDDKWAEAKEELFENLVARDVVHRYTKFTDRLGFCRGRAHCIENFMSEDILRYWFHLDDDILLGEQVIQQACRDLSHDLQDSGVLHVYVNPWAKYRLIEGGAYATLQSIGGACFIVSKETMRLTGNPYQDQTNGEQANKVFWKRVRDCGQDVVGRILKPYPCQHTGNVESTLFGKTPQWENQYAKNFITKKLLEVPPFSFPRLRLAVKNNSLEAFVRAENHTNRNSLVLPPMR